MAREVRTHIVEGLDEWDEDLRERYEDAVARHDPVRAFAAYLTDVAGSEGR